MRPRAIVVGSGAGGATAAKELQGAFDVTILEAGAQFQRLTMKLSTLQTLKKTGLLFDEREVSLIFPAMKVHKSDSDILVLSGMGHGGTTTISAGNGVRCDGDLRAIGLDLDAEFSEIYKEIPVTTEHQKRWRASTRQLFSACQASGLTPEPLPKMGDYSRCARCGRCVLGCPYGAKWDSRAFVQTALDKGAQLVDNCRVERVVVEGSRAVGVVVRQGWRRRFVSADLVVLAAGGLATPRLLESSGVACEKQLFVDPLLCVAAPWPKSYQDREICMPFVVQQEGFILSPYADYMSLFFNKAWPSAARDTLGIMIKMADSNVGSVGRDGLRKGLGAADRRRLAQAVDLCADVFAHLGVSRDKLMLGTMHAAHPGGALPLGAAQAQTLHDSRLPDNLYVADATLLPRAPGNPPILTIIALAKRVSKVCLASHLPA